MLAARVAAHAAPRRTAPAHPGSTRLAVRAAGIDGPAPGGACPFRPPPVRRRGFFREMNFTEEPSVVQRDILGGEGVAIGNWMTMDAAFVGETSLATAVLSAEQDKFAVSNPPHFKYVLGTDNLGLLDEPRHSEIKRMMQPSFAADEVDRYLPSIQAMAERYCAEWGAAGAVPRWEAALKLFTFEVICAVVGGFTFSRAELEEMSDLYATVVAGLSFPLPIGLFGLTPFGKAMRARAAIETRLMAQVQAARAAPSRPGMLSQLVRARDDSGSPLSDKALMDNFIGLLVAGHDTTASTLGLALFHLAQQPAAMAALRREQAAVRAAHGAALTPAALRAMPYAEAVLRETWRLHPVVPVVGRKTKEDVVLGEYQLKAGTNTFVALNHLQGTDPRWAGIVGEASPALFYPERFLAPEGAAPGAQLVFGGGKRYCLGASLAMAEAKVLLAVVARSLAFNVDAAKTSIGGFPFPTVKMDAVTAPLKQQ